MAREPAERSRTRPLGAMPVGLLLACVFVAACSSTEGDTRQPIDALDPNFLMYLSEWDDTDAVWLDALAASEADEWAGRDEERDE